MDWPQAKSNFILLHRQEISQSPSASPTIIYSFAPLPSPATPISNQHKSQRNNNIFSHKTITAMGICCLSEARYQQEDMDICEAYADQLHSIMKRIQNEQKSILLTLPEATKRAFKFYSHDIKLLVELNDQLIDIPCRRRQDYSQPFKWHEARYQAHLLYCKTSILLITEAVAFIEQRSGDHYKAKLTEEEKLHIRIFEAKYFKKIKSFQKQFRQKYIQHD